MTSLTENRSESWIDVQSDNWKIEDLSRRLCRILAIAKKAVQQLAPAGYTDVEEPENSVRSEKVVSETAIFLLAASKVTRSPDVLARVNEIAISLIPHERSAKTMLAIAVEPTLALDYALAHLCLNNLGYRDERLNVLLRQSIGSQAAMGRERLPHRMLEQQWITELLNADETSQNTIANHNSATHLENCASSAVSVKTVLDEPMDLLHGSREDIYAFTHALMYATRFGTAPEQLPRPKNVILLEAEAALARCLDDCDYDLAGELLLAWPLTDGTWSPTAIFAFRVLAQIEDEAGFLPTPNTRTKRADVLQGKDRTLYLLATAYHTAYVMGLLCAATAQTNKAPPKKISIRDARPGASRLILEMIDADTQYASGNSHWRNVLRNMKPVEQDALADFLLNIAIRRKIVTREFEDVTKLLKHGEIFGLTDAPAASQAAELLDRLATFAKVVQAAPNCAYAASGR